MMKTFISLNLLFAVVASSIIITSASSSSLLPSAFVGHWHGYPTSTPIGPHLLSTGGFNFYIHDTSSNSSSSSSSSSSWLMEDHLFGNSIPDSYQQYWVDVSSSSSSSLTGTNTYCGILQNFVVAVNQFAGSIAVTLNLVKLNQTYIKWSMYENELYAIDWEMIYDEKEDTLTMFVGLPTNMVTHVAVKMKRVSKVAEPQSEIAKVWKKSPLPPPCNLTFPPASSDADVDGDNNKRKGAPLFVPPRSCPHAHKIHDGMKPVNSNQNKKEKLVSFFHRHQKEQQPQRHRPLYTYCVRMNTYLDFKISWNWNTDTKKVDIHVAAKIPLDDETIHFNEPKDAYVAIGWNAKFPLMQGMEGVVGYFPTSSSTSLSSASSIPTPCVQSFYVNAPVGTPSPNTNQTIFNPSMSITEDGFLQMSFSRPFNTGFYDLSNLVPSQQNGFPIVSFAVGRAGQTCNNADFNFGYHFGLRGTHGFSFAHPGEAVPNTMKC